MIKIWNWCLTNYFVYNTYATPSPMGILKLNFLPKVQVSFKKTVSVSVYLQGLLLVRLLIGHLPTHLILFFYLNNQYVY